MKTILENNTDFNVKLEPSDWRFSAAIVGLLEYFEYIDTLETSYKVEDEYILYNSELITKENYLKFVEKKYGENLHHKYVELNLEHYNQDNNENDNTYIIKSINEKLSGNTIMKKIFKKIKFDGTNRDEILSLVNKHREELILETFRNKSDMYKNYCNTNQLFNENQKYCRLVGYYIDAPKKGKSTGFGFNMSSFVGQDIQEFDFIPFAFINDNYEINRLTSAKQVFQEKIKADIENLELENKYRGIKYSLFKGIIESSDFIEYDVEVIVKDRDKDYFETLYIRKQSIDILKKINERKIDYNSLCFSYKINDNYYKKVMECILNNTLLDDVIDLLLKEKKNYYTVYQLININDLIRGEKIMDDKIRKIIHACANEVRNKIPENKLESYRQKLTSSIIFKDYDRVCQILLQLSGYSDVYFSFADELFMDFEKNKDIAYTFINALGKSNKFNENTNEQNK